MTLTKQDISEIKGALREETKNLASKNDVESAIDNLARIVAKGFEHTASKIEIIALGAKVDHLSTRADHVDATLSVMARDIADIKKHFVYRDEFEDLMARVKHLETKLGVQSGK